jgi:hypothetical protein
VTQAYNFSNLGGGGAKNCDSRPGQAKGKQDPISTNKLRLLVHACHLTYTGGKKYHYGLGQIDKILRPYLETHLK